MTDAIRGAVSLCTALAILLTLAGYFGHAHPAFDTLGALRIQFAVAFVGVLLFSVAFAALTARMLALTGLMIAGAGIAPAALPAERVTSADLSVYSQNLRYDNGSPEAVLSAIEASDADVLVLQEVSEGNMRVIDRLRRRYPASIVCDFTGVGGVAILSRIPDTGPTGCAEGGGAAWLRVVTASGPLTVVGLHLYWPWPYGQAAHVDRLAPALSALAEPVLIAGDFNAPPWTHSVDRIEAATGTRVVGGLRLTYRRSEIWPGLPLDHVLVSEDIAAETRQLGTSGSDHAALLSRVAFRVRAAVR
ncbi:hypothetical protein GE300_09795 [Rhodobacteraceae bacterium 2CG4]|uniref:Endonuclease/exonuclease/phosphatase domain-containing protein n=1 Tax=Halovulum marinum TaxID=2662447 RepID=A0A6L5Z0R1_9RHOB|nr:endonuclease/exonuclease/phosphatase family protein [Halovulum marinum]MSU89899.1 hypothetical protein [Halovulum marinum]